MTKLNVGCGQKKKEGYIGIDKNDYRQEYVRDIEKYCLPFNDNSVDEIFCEHTLEHLDNPMFVINEFWRILKPEGKAIIIVPHKDNLKAYALRHKRYYNEYTFKALETDAVQKKWKIISQVVNDRPDIYCELQPLKPENNKKLLSEELDIGCGWAKHRGTVGIDIKDFGQEIIWDITKGLPFSDNTFRVVYAHSILEHLYPDDVIFVMKECHRILKKDGVFDIVVPYAGSEGSFRDPTHKSFWTENTFNYFCGPRQYYDLDPENKFRFKKIEIKRKDHGAVHAKLSPIKYAKLSPIERYI